MAYRLLGTQTPAQFLRRHWQKEPLLVRGAFNSTPLRLGRDELFALAGRDDLQSRIVTRSRGRWQVRHGPFSARMLARVSDRGWTLLVQGMEQALPEAERLLQSFSFIPHARLDDLMASYAPPGGGVGPHFDSYDVFLIQSEGRRLWKLSAQRDLDLVEGAPLRILKRFRATREWTLNAGDMLYLPPRYAHDGVAVTPCITLSVGFRAPGAQELNMRFLEFLQDRLQLEGIYEDPDLRVQRHPAHISATLLKRIMRLLQGTRWTTADVMQFAGTYLTEPTPEAVFAPPGRKLSPDAFVAAVRNSGLRLDLKSRMLFRDDCVFINGECHTPATSAMPVLVQLADRRRVGSAALNAAAADLLHQWYLCGYVRIGEDYRHG